MQDVTISKAPKGSTSAMSAAINKHPQQSTPNSSYGTSKQKTSPCKTLQEILADKKREQASKHLLEQMGQQKPATQQSKFGHPHSVSKILSRPDVSKVNW